MIRLKEKYIINNQGKIINVVMPQEEYYKLLSYIDKLENTIARNKKLALKVSFEELKDKISELVPHNTYKLNDYL